VVDQTYEHIELIMIDDCSPEPPQETVAYPIPSDIQLSFLRYDHNQGHAVARNTRMEAAEDEFIAFLDDEVAKDEDRKTNTAILRYF
jgi:glycosyltransferase involved in cell wall biosynthesis